MAFNPELGSTSPAVLLDNAKRLDELVNGPAADVPDRGGDALYSWRQIMAKIDELRQDLIPLSKQYMTLAAAQADIANIPEGSTTYYRSPDDSALAIEVINTAGTLVATGRKMPSQESVNKAIEDLFFALNTQISLVSSESKDIDELYVRNRVRDLDTAISGYLTPLDYIRQYGSEIEYSKSHTSDAIFKLESLSSRVLPASAISRSSIPWAWRLAFLCWKANQLQARSGPQAMWSSP